MTGESCWLHVMEPAYRVSFSVGVAVKGSVDGRVAPYVPLLTPLLPPSLVSSTAQSVCVFGGTFSDNHLEVYCRTEVPAGGWEEL